MKRLLICLIIAILFWVGCSHDYSVTFTGNVTSTYLYTSTTTINGIIEKSYATGVFLDDGSFFRIVGKYDIEPGTHEFKLIPSSDGWNQVKEIK